jgi:hypothetical protein
MPPPGAFYQGPPPPWGYPPPIRPLYIPYPVMPPPPRYIPYPVPMGPPPGQMYSDPAPAAPPKKHNKALFFTGLLAGAAGLALLGATLAHGVHGGHLPPAVFLGGGLTAVGGLTAFINRPKH